METAPQINVTNPDAITYHTDELVFTILGGIRLEGDYSGEAFHPIPEQCLSPVPGKLYAPQII